jgi:uncharacterized protein
MLPITVFIVLILLIDIYTYKGLRTLLKKPVNPAFAVLLRTAFWLVPLILFISVAYMLYFRPDGPDPRVFNGHFYIIAFTMLFYLPKLVFIFFHLIEDIVFVSESALLSVKSYFSKSRSQRIRGPRRSFFSRTGIVIALIPFLAVIYGVAIGRFDFQVIEKKVEFETLPPAFDGFRIVHISDLHLGSFHGYKDQVRQAVEIINRLEPDMIVFTGDLVNNFTAEADGFVDILAGMEASYGKYSILGNHDYGDYYQWSSDAEKAQNMNDMLVIQEKMGFNLLMNEWDSIEINGDKIAVIGVENWGEPPFPQYGDLEMAMVGTEEFPFRLLLTHDPTHWDAEVLNETGVELTLAGHTHGMQVGIENSLVRWSPSKLRYPRWGGLYEETGQFLYVNRGLGYVAFPGRIGMPPEITVIELRTFSGDQKALPEENWMVQE